MSTRKTRKSLVCPDKKPRSGYMELTTVEVPELWLSTVESLLNKLSQCSESGSRLTLEYSNGTSVLKASFVPDTSSKTSTDTGGSTSIESKLSSQKLSPGSPSPPSPSTSTGSGYVYSQACGTCKCSFKYTIPLPGNSPLKDHRPWCPNCGTSLNSRYPTLTPL